MFALAIVKNMVKNAILQVSVNRSIGHFIELNAI